MNLLLENFIAVGVSSADKSNEKNNAEFVDCHFVDSTLGV